MPVVPGMERSFFTEVSDYEHVNPDNGGDDQDRMKRDYTVAGLTLSPPPPRASH